MRRVYVVRWPFVVAAILAGGVAFAFGCSGATPPERACVLASGDTVWTTGECPTAVDGLPARATLAAVRQERCAWLRLLAYGDTLNTLETGKVPQFWFLVIIPRPIARDSALPVIRFCWTLRPDSTLGGRT